MNTRRPGKSRKWPIAVLATTLAAGGAYALPHVFADGSSEPQAKSANAAAESKVSNVSGTGVSAAAGTSNLAASAAVPVRTAAVAAVGDAEVVLPVVSVDPKTASVSASRSALTELAVMGLETAKYFPLDPSENQYVKLIEARNRAVEVSSDPDAPADRIFSSSRKLEEALDRYNDEAVGSASSVKKVLAAVKSDTLNGRSESALNASERLVLLGVKEAQNKLSADSTKDGALSAYKQFLLRASEANDIESFRSSDYTAVLKQYEANIKARTEDLGDDAVEDLLEAYEVSAEALESVLDGVSGKNALDAAQASVEVTYAALTEGLTLAEAIQAAEPLLDSPAGKEKGQYAASSIGTLKRAIGKAERALETSSTAEQLTQARAALASAVSEFKSSRNS